MITTTLRVRSESNWNRFKQLAKRRHMTANAYLNLLMDEEIIRFAEASGGNQAEPSLASRRFDDTSALSPAPEGRFE